VYLPAGKWVDFWTGAVHRGPVWLGEKRWPLAVMPVFIRQGARLPFYLEPVESTNQMDLEKSAAVLFDRCYGGIFDCAIGRLAGFTVEDLAG
jgi:alpha-D-xyloside xylohydrolase